jgi:hypothetical protein
LDTDWKSVESFIGRIAESAAGKASVNAVKIVAKSTSRKVEGKAFEESCRLYSCIWVL